MRGGDGVKELWELFWLFAKIGCMTFGGGATMLPILQRELLDRRGWVTEEELVDYYAIGQCTPGVIAVNLSTFVGRKRGGDLGGVAATAGFALPSLVVIVLLAGLITRVEDLAWVQNAFAGIRACVCVQIFHAVVKLARTAVVDRWTAAIFGIVTLLGIVLDLSPVLFVLGAAAAGVLLCRLGVRKEGRA